MDYRDIISIMAIVVGPIVAVMIGQYLQGREKRRNDKLQVFRTLMADRGLGWSVESVRSLNLIEVVFRDNQAVLQQWKAYYEKMCVENPSDADIKKMKKEGDKLLEVMAGSLGYKDKVTWETIQNPYIPKGMLDSLNQQQRYQSGMLTLMSVCNERLGKSDIMASVQDKSKSQNGTA